MVHSKADDTATTAMRLRRLHDVTREMMRAESRDDVFDRATEAAADLLGFAYTTIREYDGESDALVPVATSEQLRDAGGERREYDRGESIQWIGYETGEIQVFQDITAIEDDADRSGEGSMLVVPLGEYGVLTMGSPRRNDVSDRDVELARVFGANLETAIDRVDALRELRRREKRLRRKNERLDRFSGLVAHEFRNPLNIVSGHLDLVTGTEGDEVHLESARVAVDRMDRLTESLLDLVRGDNLGDAVEPIRVDRLAEAVFEELGPEAAALTVGEVRVTSNETRLRTLLENLLDNAVSHGGPDVHVRVGPLERGGFYVADDGPGFEREDVESLFSYRPTSGTERSGLGLAIVRDIARAHDWEIAIGESRDGGARIEFATEPATREEVDHRHEPHQNRPSPT